MLAVTVPDGLAWTIVGVVLTAAMAAAGAILKLIRQGDVQAERIAQLEHTVERMAAEQARSAEKMAAQIERLNAAVIELTAMRALPRRDG